MTHRDGPAVENMIGNKTVSSIQVYSFCQWEFTVTKARVDMEIAKQPITKHGACSYSPRDCSRNRRRHFHTEFTQSIEVRGVAPVEETAGPVVFQIVNP